MSLRFKCVVYEPSSPANIRNLRELGFVRLRPGLVEPFKEHDEELASAECEGWG